MNPGRRQTDQFCTQVDPDVQRAARAAVAGLQGKGMPITLSSLTEQALAAHVTALQQQYNGGQPWPDVSHLPTNPQATRSS